MQSAQLDVKIVSTIFVDSEWSCSYLVREGVFSDGPYVVMRQIDRGQLRTAGKGAALQLEDSVVSKNDLEQLVGAVHHVLLDRLEIVVTEVKTDKAPENAADVQPAKRVELFMSRYAEKKCYSLCHPIMGEVEVEHGLDGSELLAGEVLEKVVAQVQRLDPRDTVKRRSVDPLDLVVVK